jgi:hypothetical protein
LRASHGELWASDQFTVKRPFELRDPSMLAKGVAANITGLRADVVICDDVEVSMAVTKPATKAAQNPSTLA